jgi:hypothetical protein
LHSGSNAGRCTGACSTCMLCICVCQTPGALLWPSSPRACAWYAGYQRCLELRTIRLSAASTQAGRSSDVPISTE